MKQQFIVYSSARSRSFWLSRFLNYGGWMCGHDELRHIRALDDVKSWFSMDRVGTVETSAGCWWRLADVMCPEARIVVIRRNVDEIVSSFIGTGIEFDEVELRRRVVAADAKLRQVAARHPGALVLSYGDLSSEDQCAKIFEHCLGINHDHSWYKSVAPLNLQCDLRGMFKYLNAHDVQLCRVARQAKQKILTRMSRRKVVSDGFTFQQEPFDVFFRDGKHLFEEHLVQIGEEPSNAGLNNIELMKNLADIGCLHVTTARQNGRMFGYLMVATGPSFARRGVTEAMNAVFYTSPMASRIGVKLHRASVKFLKEIGVDTLYMRVGHRGDGVRLAPLYKRIGAQEFGSMFSLDLQGAV